MKKISIVVPIYNEVELIDTFIEQIQELSINHEIIFSCDPSNDGSEKKLEDYSKSSSGSIKTLVMSRRFGQHPAIFAGLEYSSGDAVIVMDIDGQDPIELIPEMIQKWEEGYEVVYGKRTSRTGENLIKKMISKIGLKMISRFSKINIPKDLTILKSTASCSICVFVEMIDVGTIIANEVPTDKCILVTISKSRTVKA